MQHRTGVFIKTDCAVPHLFCKDCFREYFRNYVDQHPSNPQRPRTLKNVPCPFCRTFLCRATLAFTLEAQLAFLNELPVHTPVEEIITHDSDLEAERGRTQRIQRAYEVLGHAHASKKGEAANYNGTNETTMFTKGAVNLPASSQDLRYLRISFKPKKTEQRRFEYVVVTTMKDKISNIGDVWLGILWGEQDGAYLNQKHFSLKGQALDWSTSVLKLGVTNGTWLDFEI